MILNHEDIVERIDKNDIIIKPLDWARVGTNSYDVVLGRKILIPNIDATINLRLCKPDYQEYEMSSVGFHLKAGAFILGMTEEYCENVANDLVPMIEGRSTLGRCGLSVHETAGFGDIGFNGHWTLEIHAKLPIFIWPGMPIAQLYWIRTNPSEHRYKGRYQNQESVHGPKTFKE